MAILDLQVIQDDERFRAELASVATDGKRKWVYARKPRGRFYTLRTLVSIVLLAFLAGAPFVTVGGHQFLLLNILERQFVFFGIPFWPDDLYLVAVLFLLGVVSIVLFTAILGRIWCGWLCPQTVFLEMVFRKLEWLIEGSPGAQHARARGPWTFDRLWRFALKQSLFFVISFLIANIFLAYVVSSKTLLSFVREGPAAHLETFLGLIFFTFVFYAVFARYREQACLVACPYGRFMSALVDENTVTITYDTTRGEPRSKWHRDDQRATEETGHCIDCHACVAVCPTGIDIRNGIQLECVACTACIDACDEIMEKTGLKKGLIRYASLNAITTRAKRWLTPRIKAYITIWILLVGVVITLFVTRSVFDVNILRAPGTTWTKTADGIANFYQLNIINKQAVAVPYGLAVLSPAGARITPLGLPKRVEAGEGMKGRFLITIPPTVEAAEREHSKHAIPEVDIVLGITSNGALLKQVRTELILP